MQEASQPPFDRWCGIGLGSLWPMDNTKITAHGNRLYNQTSTWLYYFYHTILVISLTFDTIKVRISSAKMSRRCTTAVTSLTWDDTKKSIRMSHHPLSQFYSRFIFWLVLLSTPSTPQSLIPSKLWHYSMLLTTSPLLHSSMYAVPMIALNGNLHRTLANRHVSSLEGRKAVSPWVRTNNIDPSTAWHSSIAWGTASTIGLLCLIRLYRTGFTRSGMESR